ncbi:hypothetical protein F66182_3328 [Fusarium sp. NRRL 66182]|nr:hypothetical protein F66182_3328 [Fusarium sp. NRRL 66182]
MYKQRSHETHYSTHVPQIEARQGQYEVALLGDSLFERFKTTGRLLSINKNAKVINLGVGGDKILNVQYRIDQGLVKSLKQHQTNLKLIYVHMGSNNLKKNGLRQQDAETYDAMIRELRTEYPDIPIIITALFIQRDLGLDVIENDNKTLQNIAEANGCEFLPFGHDQAGIMSDDKVHLNAFGYTKWNDILRSDMNKLRN